MTTNQLERYARTSVNLDNITNLNRRRSRQLLNRHNNKNHKDFNISNRHHLKDLNDWRPIRGSYGNRGRGRYIGVESRLGHHLNGLNLLNHQKPSFYRNSYPSVTGLEVTVMTSDFFSQVRLPYSEVIETLNLFFRPNIKNDQQLESNR